MGVLWLFDVVFTTCSVSLLSPYPLLCMATELCSVSSAPEKGLDGVFILFVCLFVLNALNQYSFDIF